MNEKTLPPLQFVTAIAHAAGLGANVVVSFSGFEHLEGQAAAMPITHRLVIQREQLAQGIEFLQNWLNGVQPEKTGHIQ